MSAMVSQLQSLVCPCQHAGFTISGYVSNGIQPISNTRPQAQLTLVHGLMTHTRHKQQCSLHHRRGITASWI